MKKSPPIQKAYTEKFAADPGKLATEPELVADESVKNAADTGKVATDIDKFGKAEPAKFTAREEKSPPGQRIRPANQENFDDPEKDADKLVKVAGKPKNKSADTEKSALSW